MDEINKNLEEQIQLKKMYLQKAEQAREDYRAYVNKAAITETRIKALRSGNSDLSDQDALCLSFTEMFC